LGRKSPKRRTLRLWPEYVRELSAIETLRNSAEQELSQGGKAEAFSNAVYTSTRMPLELRGQIAILRRMRLFLIEL
jgi:hypothetical protein